MKNLILRKSILVLVAIIWMSNYGEAQIWKRIQKRVEDRAERKVEQKINREVDKKVDETMDPVLYGDPNKERDENEEKEKAEEQEKRVQDMMAQYMGASKVELPESYDFEMSIRYAVSSGNKEETEMTYLISDEDHWGFSTTESDNNNTIVIDHKRQVVVMYTEDRGKKTGMKLPSMMNQQFLDAVDDATPDDDKFDLRETGKTKKILGYLCKQYIATTDQGVSEIWMTNELKASLSKIFSSSMSRSKKTPKYAAAIQMLDGAFMEFIYTDHKKQKNNMHMLAVSVDTKPKPIRQSDYQWPEF